MSFLSSLLTFVSKLDLTKNRQAIVAVLSAVGAVGAQVLASFSGLLPPHVAAVVTSVLAVVAGIAGFLRKAEPAE